MTGRENETMTEQETKLIYLAASQIFRLLSYNSVRLGCCSGFTHNAPHRIMLPAIAHF